MFSCPISMGGCTSESMSKPSARRNDLSIFSVLSSAFCNLSLALFNKSPVAAIVSLNVSNFLRKSDSILNTSAELFSILSVLKPILNEFNSAAALVGPVTITR